MAARPAVSVHGPDGASSGSTLPLPDVFSAPLRHDIVQSVHRDMAKNNRQPYGVSRRAGHQTSAESWGTGRAVSRIPRVGGGGTHRSGQGAFGNQCRGGHMFAPTRVFRRWHRRINKNLRRYAVSSALAASAVPALVMARGHRISKVSEIPLVVSDEVQGVKKTKDAVALLDRLQAKEDADKAKNTRKIRPGKGKWRNRRFITRKGPLIVFNKNEGGWAGFHNLPGVDTCYVSALNLLLCAPGGHLGRFIIWSESAFKALDGLFGVGNKMAKSRNYRLPRPVCSNTDVTRIINSQEIQNACRKKREAPKKKLGNRNPLKNRKAMVKLNPNYNNMRSRARQVLLAHLRGKPAKSQTKKSPAAKKSPAKAAAKKSGKK